MAVFHRCWSLARRFCARRYENVAIRIPPGEHISHGRISMTTSSSALRFILSHRSFINTSGGNPPPRRPDMGGHIVGFLMLAGLALAATRAQAILIYGTSGNDIARFDSGATGVVPSVPVTGLQPGESLV